MRPYIAKCAVLKKNKAYLSINMLQFAALLLRYTKETSTASVSLIVQAEKRFCDLQTINLACPSTMTYRLLHISQCGSRKIECHTYFSNVIVKTKIFIKSYTYVHILAYWNSLFIYHIDFRVLRYRLMVKIYHSSTNWFKCGRTLRNKGRFQKDAMKKGWTTRNTYNRGSVYVVGIVGVREIVQDHSRVIVGKCRAGSILFDVSLTLCNLRRRWIGLVRAQRCPFLIQTILILQMIFHVTLCKWNFNHFITKLALSLENIKESTKYLLSGK